MSVKPEGIEKSLIESWESWDGDQEMLQFYNVVLKHNFGPHQSGDKVNCLTIHLGKSKMEIYDEEGNITFAADLVLGWIDPTVDFYPAYDMG